MAQRGGSVMSHVRFDAKVYSPIIPSGECDILLSFEELEAARYLAYLNSGSYVIINHCRISPPSVITGKETYPDVIPIIRGKTDKVRLVEGDELAHKVGNPRGVNIVLLGILSTLLKVEEELWIQCLNDMIPEKIRSINIEGFRQGRQVSLG